MERELIVERTRAGLMSLSAWPQGRSQAQDDREQDRVSQEAAGQRCATQDVAKNLGVSVPTLYRWVPASTHA
jgi:DNA invertase Pin-like site-specific DNA recombinase